LDAPAAIRLEGSEPVSHSPEEVARRLYAHPERDPGRDAALAEGLRELAILAGCKNPLVKSALPTK
jgi:hypothetical protein